MFDCQPRRTTPLGGQASLATAEQGLNGDFEQSRAGRW